MRVFVDDIPVDILPGMTVRHALVAAGWGNGALSLLQVRDEWGNVVGLGGAISDGIRLTTGRSQARNIE
jgi:hypothetical protein